MEKRNNPKTKLVGTPSGEFGIITGNWHKILRMSRQKGRKAVGGTW